MRPSSKMLTAALALAFAMPARAEITLYRDKTAYLSAAGGTAGTVTFDGGPASAEWTSGNQWPGVWLTLCGWPGPPCYQSSAVLWEGSALVYQPLSTVVTTLEGGFPPPAPYTVSIAQALAFDLSGDTAGTFLSLVKDSGMETISLDGTVGFVGLVASEPFDYFALGKNVSSPGYGASFTLDTLYLPPAIPEPATASLVLLGLLLLARREPRRGP